MESVVLIAHDQKCEMTMLPSSCAVLMFTTVPILTVYFLCRMLLCKLILIVQIVYKCFARVYLSELLSHGKNIDIVSTQL